MPKKVVIIGNGIAGITAARFIRKNSDYSITVISSETKYFFARTALMYVFMGHMKFEHTKPYEDSFWKKNKINLLQGHVNAISFEEKKLTLESGSEVSYDVLIISTGSQSKKIGCDGEDLEGVATLYNHNDLLKMQKLTETVKNAVVIGGGLVGVEMAEMLRSKDIDVTFLIREESFWRDVLPTEESKLVSNHLNEHKIKIIPGTQVSSFIGDEKGRLESISTNSGQSIFTQFAGVAIGVKPNVDFLRNSELEIEKGIQVNSYLETNIPDVYAIGDCVQIKEPQPGRRPIEPVWYTGKFMGEVVARSICGDKTIYNPGQWFNSAKFFDIEYQTYGFVPPDKVSGIEWFYWEHPDGKKSIRLAWEQSTGNFAGINALGIRISHPLMDQWLSEKKDIGFVLSHLSLANFDPEFFNRYENIIKEKFYYQFPEFSTKNISAI